MSKKYTCPMHPDIVQNKPGVCATCDMSLVEAGGNDVLAESSPYDHHTVSPGLNKMAASATLHCLAGCAIGEVAGLIIGTALGLSAFATIILAIVLAFVFGFTLSTIPLRKAGLGFLAALSVVFAADTLSIATMEIVDNAVMLTIPGAMSAGLVDPLFWVSMPMALTVAYVAAYPVNRYLLTKGKGHALVMKYHKHDHSSPAAFDTKWLLYGLIGFFIGGLVVASSNSVDPSSARPKHTYINLEKN